MKLLQIIFIIVAVGVLGYLGVDVYKRFQENQTVYTEIVSLTNSLTASLEESRSSKSENTEHSREVSAMPQEEVIENIQPQENQEELPQDSPTEEITAQQAPEEPRNEKSIYTVIDDENEIKKIFKTTLSIEQAQEVLKKTGFYNGPIDGKLREALKKAIIEFQIAHDLDPDGVIGKKTTRIIEQYLEKQDQ